MTAVKQGGADAGEYVTRLFHDARMPKDVVIGNMVIFLSRIKPALDERLVSSIEAAEAVS